MKKIGIISISLFSIVAGVIGIVSITNYLFGQTNINLEDTQQTASETTTYEDLSSINLPDGINTLTSDVLNSQTISVADTYVTNSKTSLSSESTKVLQISLADNITAIPFKSNLQGTAGFQCDSTLDNTWSISQWGNENSFCSATAKNNSTNNQAPCANASYIRTTSATRFCLWKDTKKIELGLNTELYKNKGCTIHSDANNANNPGGYSLGLTWNPKYDDITSASKLNLSKLDKLEISAGVSTDYAKFGKCDSTVPLDKILGNSNNRNSIVFTHLNVILTEVDPTTNQGLNTMFYQVYLYDNRFFAPYGSKPTSSGIYQNCSLPSTVSASGGFSVYSDPVEKVYGQTYAEPNKGTVNYKMNVLPNIINAMKSLKTSSGQACWTSKVDLNRVRITGMTIETEMYNPTIFTTSITNPNLILTYK